MKVINVKLKLWVLINEIKLKKKKKCKWGQTIKKPRD